LRAEPVVGDAVMGDAVGGCSVERPCSDRLV